MSLNRLILTKRKVCRRVIGIKSACSPINTGTSSYESCSNFKLPSGGDFESSQFLHDARGQRVFKSEAQVAQTIPNETTLGAPFVDWLFSNFQWLFKAAQSNATLGQSYVYADSHLPSYALLGEYGNGGSQAQGRIEYLWLPLDSGEAMPIGLFHNDRLYAVHTDHIHTPRLITDSANQPVWQWPYSAFGDNKPTGVLTPTTNPASAYTQDPISLVKLQATAPALTYNPRYPGQYFDEESNLSYNTFRSYNAAQGRYTQNDPIGLDGGWLRFGYANQNALSHFDPDGLLFMSTVGGLQRGTTLDQAATFGAPGNAATIAGLGGAVGGAAASGAGIGYMTLVPAPLRTAIGLIKGLRDDAMAPPVPPQPPLLTPPAIIRPGGFSPPPPPPGICPRP